MLKVDNVYSGYAGSQVVKGVSLRVNAGDIVSIIGPNGAGKSTLLKSIFGVVPLLSGRMTFFGEEIMNMSSDMLVKKGIGYVPQGRVVFPNLTVEENLRMGGYLLDSHVCRERLEQVYDLFPQLARRKLLLAGVLSGGQQQMVSIGRALMLKPKLLLLDEPSLGLAPVVMREVFEKILEVNSFGTTIILVEQNAHQAVKIASKIIVLEQGRIALEGGKEILDSPRIKELYLGH